jgi:hypothetical protein
MRMMPERIEISLPLPPDILRPNRIAGADRRTVTNARRLVRKEAGQVAASAWRGRYRCDLPRWTHVRATATFSGVSSLMDGPNAETWIKAIVDGIADALMAGNDHGWRWEGEPRFVKGAGGVVIEVWPVESEGE